MSDAVASYFFRTRNGISAEVAARVKLSNQTLTCSCHAVKPVFPVSGSRVHPITVFHELDALGMDIVLMADAGICGPPDGIAEGGWAMQQSVDSYLAETTVEEYAKDHFELGRAL